MNAVEHTEGTNATRRTRLIRRLVVSARLLMSFVLALALTLSLFVLAGWALRPENHPPWPYIIVAVGLLLGSSAGMGWLAVRQNVWPWRVAAGAVSGFVLGLLLVFSVWLHLSYPQSGYVSKERSQRPNRSLHETAGPRKTSRPFSSETAESTR